VLSDEKQVRGRYRTRERKEDDKEGQRREGQGRDSTSPGSVQALRAVASLEEEEAEENAD